MTSTPYTPAPDVKARAVETLSAEAVERLATVARLRAELEAADAEVETQETAFFSSIAPLTARTADLKVQVTLAEQEAKALALELYRADPSSKKPVAGASIRIKTGAGSIRALVQQVALLPPLVSALQGGGAARLAERVLHS